MPVDGKSQEVAHEVIQCRRRDSTVDKQFEAEGETEETEHQDEVTDSSSKLEKKLTVSKADIRENHEETGVKQRMQEVEPVQYTSIYESSGDQNEEEDQLDPREDVQTVTSESPQPLRQLQTDDPSKENVERTIQSIGGEEDGVLVSEEIERQLSLEGDGAVEMNAVVRVDVDEEGKHLDEQELEREDKKKEPKGTLSV